MRVAHLFLPVHLILPYTPTGLFCIDRNVSISTSDEKTTLGDSPSCLCGQSCVWPSGGDLQWCGPAKGAEPVSHQVWRRMSVYVIYWRSIFWTSWVNFRRHLSSNRRRILADFVNINTYFCTDNSGELITFHNSR